MLVYGKKYFERIMEILETVLDTQQEKIVLAAQKFAEVFENGNSIYVFGCSHAGIIAEELFYRTGGLAVINPIFNPTLMLNTRPVTMTSTAERLEGFGSAILNQSPVKAGDAILIHSVSGRNPVVIEIALEAKKIGLFVIALTNLTYSQNVTSRHSSGNKLYDVADIVINNCGDFEDGTITLEGLNQTIGPSSTVIGAAIGNAIVIETAHILLEKGITPPVYRSANVDDGDAFNKELVEKYKDRIHYL